MSLFSHSNVDRRHATARANHAVAMLLLLVLMTVGACQSNDTDASSDDSVTTNESHSEDVSQQDESDDNVAQLLTGSLAEWAAAPINDRMKAAKIAMGPQDESQSDLDYNGKIVDLEACLTDAAGDVEDPSMPVQDVMDECMDEIEL